MLNFYKFYNAKGLDKDEYDPLIDRINYVDYTDEFKPIEHIIKKKPWYSYSYARFVIKGRWLEAEHYIMKSPEYAYYYALNVIKGRWEEAEPFIKSDEYWWTYYRRALNIC